MDRDAEHRELDESTDDATAGDAPTPTPPEPTGPEPSGIASVDGAIARLRDVESAPLDTHVEIFDDVQRQLHDALAELDDEQ